MDSTDGPVHHTLIASALLGNGTGRSLAMNSPPIARPALPSKARPRARARGPRARETGPGADRGGLLVDDVEVSFCRSTNTAVRGCLAPPLRFAPPKPPS